MSLIQNRSRWRLPYLYDLLKELVNRDIKLLYKRSVLGIAWTLISPLLQLAVFAFIFQLVLPVEIPNYSSFVFTGLLAWNWFQNSLFQATGVIINSRPLIRQPGFPTPILPVVTVTTNLIHFILALPVLIIFILIDGIKLTPLIIFLPILQIIQFALTVTISYILAALNVTFRDTQHTIGVLLQLFFYLTPIFYNITAVPQNYQSLYLINPMANLVTAYRDILITGNQPNWLALLLLAVSITIILPIGYFYFKRQSARFVEEI